MKDGENQHIESSDLHEGHKSLDLFSPVANFDDLTGSGNSGKIMKAQSDDLFIPVSAPTILVVVIYRILDDRGWLVSERFYPVLQSIQGLLPFPPLLMAFHPCVAESGETFVFPRKIDPPGLKANSWNQSLDEALQQSGQWMRVWPDSQTERYHYEHVKGPDGILLEYPDFEADLAASLSANVIDRVDHPIIETILAERLRNKALQASKPDEEIY